jgi:Ser/Thr protein kinase RdoA (MazF antagonist)
MIDVDEVAAALGVDFLGRLPHGEGTGAYAVRTPDGTSAVLKLFTGDVFDFNAPSAFIETLRARGYPAPRIYAAGVIDGVRYEVQERLAGEPLEQPARAHVEPLHALIERQRDVGFPGRAPWVDDIVTSVLDGRSGYCEHAAMRAHSDATRELLDRLQRVADAASGVDVATTDVVHYDFSPYNILVSGDRITGVIDWDGATSGDAAFDLVTLAAFTYDYGVRDQLLVVAATMTDPAAIALYAAHMVLRQVDWSLRNHDDATVQWFMGIGDALLGRTAQIRRPGR